MKRERNDLVIERNVTARRKREYKAKSLNFGHAESTFEFMKEHEIAPWVFYAQKPLFRKSLLQTVLLFHILTGTERVVKHRFPFTLEMDEWHNDVNENPGRTAQAVTYILLNGAKISGLRPLTSEQFVKVNSSYIRENAFPVSLLSEAKRVVRKFRERLQRALKKLNGRENLLRIPTNNRHCEEYLLDTFHPDIFCCSV